MTSWRTVLRKNILRLQWFTRAMIDERFLEDTVVLRICGYALNYILEEHTSQSIFITKIPD